MPALLVAALVLSLPAADLSVSISDKGVVEVRDAVGPLARIVLTAHGPNWAGVSQDGPAAQVEREGAEVRGAIPMPQGSQGVLRFVERVAQENGRVLLDYEVEFTEDSALQGAYVSVYLPVERFLGRRARLLPADEEHVFPEDPNAQRFSGPARALVCDLGDGQALFLANMAGERVLLEDMRRFGGPVYELRYFLAQGSVGAGQRAVRRFVLVEAPVEEVGRLTAELAPESKIDLSRPYAIVSENGKVQVGLGREVLATMGMFIHGPGWAGSDQGEARWSGAYGGHLERTFVGELAVANSGGKRARLYEQAAADSHSLSLRYRFEFPEDTPLNSFQVSALLPLAAWVGAEVVGEGGEQLSVVLPKEKSGPHLARATVRRVTVRKAGLPTLQFDLDEGTPLLVQDNRTWGANEVELRFIFGAGDATTIAAGTNVERTFRLSSQPSLQPVVDPGLVYDAYDQSEWIPYTLPWDDCPVDLSFLNDKPAGKHGFLTVRDGRFVFEDGTPARFWGTCFSAGANFPTHEQSEIIARRLAKFGINIVRTHHADANWSEMNFFGKTAQGTRQLDPEAMDRFDYLIYCLEREGIYVYLDQLVHRKFTEADGVDSADQLENAAKPYSNFDPKLIELQREFSRMLFEHVNPYTGRAYKDDPGIVLMEFANENDLFAQSVELEPYRSRLEETFRAWAKERALAVPEGKVDFRQRTDAVMAFLTDVQRRFYVEQARYLRDQVGVRIPMTGSNWSINAALLAALEACDYTDSHAYWHHPARDGSVGNTPALRVPTPLVDGLSFNRLAGKPFFVSEWNEPWPNEWRAEMPLYLAAAAAFQGWDGLAIYTHTHHASRLAQTNFLSGAFEAFNDPALYGLFPHAALIFRRGDVSEARERWVILVPEDRIATARSLRPWGDVPALTGTALAHRVEMALGQAPAGATRLLSPGDVPFPGELGEVRSDTGELYHSWRHGYMTIDTPRTQAALGFLGEVGGIALSSLELECRTDFATIALSSLTDDPIARSNRLLLTAVGRVENSGTRYDLLHRRLVNSGRSPILCQPIVATVRLRTAKGTVKVYPVRPDGSRGEALQSSYRDGLLTFEIGPQARSIYYELVAE